MDCGKEEMNTKRISRRVFTAVCSSAVVSVAQVTSGAIAASASPVSDIGHSLINSDTYSRCVDSAINYLRSHGQAEDGSFGNQAGIGVTALVTTAVLRHGRSVRDPLVANALKYIEKNVYSDGGVYSSGGMLANYETCLVIMCLNEANADHRYDQLLRDAENYIRGYQWDETKGKDRADSAYGGTGYGKKKRPDLSNTAFFINALKSCGRGPSDPDECGPDDPAIQKAWCSSRAVKTWRASTIRRRLLPKIRDGGFYYTCGRPAAARGRRDGRGRTARLCLDDLQRPEEHAPCWPRTGRPSRESRRHMDPRQLRSKVESGPGQRRIVLLLPRFRQDFEHPGRLVVRGHRWRFA